VPPGTSPGSHYLGLAAEGVAPAPSGGTTLTGRLVMIVELQVAGTVTESLSIKNRSVAGLVWQRSWPISLELQNNGTVEIVPHGRVIIQNWRGEEISSQEISLGNQLLPGAIRQFNSQIAASSINWPGLYRLRVEIKYGKTNQTSFTTTNLWYFPLSSLVSLGLILTIIVLLKVAKRNKRD